MKVVTALGVACIVGLFFFGSTPLETVGLLFLGYVVLVQIMIVVGILRAGSPPDANRWQWFDALMDWINLRF